jgi:hypothetical protein
MKRKFVIFMLFYIAMSSLAQELRMGMAKNVNGKDYYVPVELESNFLIDKLLQSAENDTIVTADFYVKKIKKVETKGTKQLYYIYITNRGHLYKLVTIGDKATRSKGVKIKKGETIHMTIIPVCQTVLNGMIAFDYEVWHPFGDFFVQRADFKYELDNFYKTDGLDGLYLKQDTLHAPIATYKQALKYLLKYKEYKQYLKERGAKKEKYIVMTTIYDFREDAYDFRDIPGVQVGIPGEPYEDRRMQDLNKYEKGKIVISFSSIENDFFTITVQVASRELSNPQSADLWFTGLSKVFLFKQTNSGIEYIKSSWWRD